MLDESQMTVTGAIQCRYSTEFDLEKHFLLRKKVPFLKKCLDFSSLSLFLSSFIWSVLLFCFYFFKFPTSSFSFDPSFFTRSRLARHQLRTPGLLHRYPWGQCPRWADERSSVICIQSLSCPTVPCVSVWGKKHSGCSMTYDFSKIAEYEIGLVSLSGHQRVKGSA